MEMLLYNVTGVENGDMTVRNWIVIWRRTWMENTKLDVVQIVAVLAIL